MSNKPPVRLALYEEKFREGLLAFQLPAEQAEFTGLPEETIADALQDEGKVPVVIMAGEKPVGFFILHSGAGIAGFYIHWSEALLLRAFLIDYTCQGQGFAKAAMALLPGFVRIHFPAVREVVLAVNERNLPAGQLYLRAGFRDHGLRRNGAKGSQMILQYSLEKFSADSGGVMDNEEVLRGRLTGSITRSPLLMDVFHRAGSLTPYPYYIGAGCLVQTVWNELTGRAPEYGIEDIDIIYYDEDLRYSVEDQMIQRGRELFDRTPIPVNIKNQARVHLWYEEKFGKRLMPYASLESAIDSWPTTVTALGARLTGSGEWQIYAPFGLKDLFGLTLRPNKALITEEIYHSKTFKWKQKWPELKIMPWA